MTAAHLFVADLDRPEIAEGDRHHVERVLRLRPGEEIGVSDGAGGFRLCVLSAGLELEPVADLERTDPPAPTITIGFAVVKGDRPEWIVQKLTELGVDRIIPFFAERTIVRWDGDRAARNHERLRKVAHEAAMQSRRRWLPEVAAPTAFSALVSDGGGGPGALAQPALASFAGAPPSLATPVVLVGPEGGWAPAELAAVPRTVGLGPTVLRAETAAIAAATLLTALRSGLVRPAPPD